MTAMMTRKRNTSRGFGSGIINGTVTPIGGGPSSPFKATSGWSSAEETQITESEGHPWSGKSSRGDIGGPFKTIRRYFGDESLGNKTFSFGQQIGSDFVKATYTGPLTPKHPALFDFPPDGSSSNLELNKAGTNAIAACKPTNPIVDLSTALGEIRNDGLPHLVGAQTWRDRALGARQAGSEYLNVVFGWKPLISDIKDFSSGVSNFDAVISQYERDAGKHVRRRFNFPVRRESSSRIYQEEQRAFMQPFNSCFLDGPRGRIILSEKFEQRRWFSGAFTYHLPRGYDSRNAVSRYALIAKKVFGLNLTPETLWNIAPWSWATDWFANTGDIISNTVSYAQDGLVLHYGYIMEHTIVSHTYSWDGPTGLGGGATPSPITLVTETKLRRRANPFGFGVEWSGLSPLQLSIAAALGLSRA